MIRRQRRVEIKVEDEVSVAVRGGAPSTAALCAQCGGVMLPTLVAARAAATSVREIYRRVESGAMHYAEVGGEGRVCSGV